ncbi:MAG TPA: exodeoxyribonuclease III [Sutterella sp.]|nr:exodeoxyribonuclease III [Sutterella sp.]
MKLATFNVNGINARLTGLIDWLKSSNVDAVALQETKTLDEQFPVEAFEEAGYDAFFTGQKSYNGVALLVRRDSFKSAELTAKAIPNYPDPAKRVIAVTLEESSGKKWTFIGAYFPNGREVGCDKYLYKLDWIAALTRWVRSLIEKKKGLVLAGDFNIAPTDADVWNPESWKGKILVSAPERDAYYGLLNVGLIDLWGRFPHATGTYSWWDYRQQGFEKNQGLRIDHILASATPTSRLSDIFIDTAPRATDRPSDHAPVIAVFDEPREGELF